MSFPAALTLRARREGRIRPRLDELRRALAAVGDPQRALRSILIVGTNGKGSTAVLLDAILRAHGVTTGLYTSPHLVRVEERIRVMNETIPEADLARELAVLDAHPELTFFETLTAAAFAYFATRGVEVAVLEAGMGGSWDATRLAESEIAGLTNVGSDHRSWLGEAAAERARDKGQALAAARWAVFGDGVDADAARAAAVPHARRAASLVTWSPDRDRCRWRFPGGDTIIDLPAAGGHQQHNLQLALALAVCAAEAGWIESLDGERVRRAIAGVSWPGRLTRHLIDGRSVLIDCAHNLEAAQSLASYLSSLERRHNLLFSCLADKPLDAMARTLRPVVDRVAVCPLDDPRAIPVERLAAVFPNAIVAEDPRAGFRQLADPVVAAGSIRLAGWLIGISESML
jgi:dihydrofolate synthase/folylpolyglutamate synthase